MNQGSILHEQHKGAPGSAERPFKSTWTNLRNGVTYIQTQYPSGKLWVKDTGGGGGSVNSVTGLDTDNTDPLNPIVRIAVDGSTIRGAGTSADPLVANIGSSKLLVSYHMNNNFSPNSLQDYYFGQQSSIGNTINTTVAVPIPAGTLTEVITNTYVAGSFGSSEGSTLTLWTNTNSGTPTTDVIATGVKFASANPRNFSQSFTGLSIPVVSGGSFIQVATPNWTSAPSSVQIRVSLIIEL